jgi:hypothetical protein
VLFEIFEGRAVKAEPYGLALHVAHSQEHARECFWDDALQSGFQECKECIFSFLYVIDVMKLSAICTSWKDTVFQNTAVAGVCQFLERCEELANLNRALFKPSIG